MKYINTKQRYGRIVHLKDEMDKFIKYVALDKEMEDLEILSVWDECVGDVIAKYSKPVGIKNNKLLISAENASWRYELNLNKKEILEKINSKIKEKKKRVIKDIIFV